jgi:hypothetical protein
MRCNAETNPRSFFPVMRTDWRLKNTVMLHLSVGILTPTRDLVRFGFGFHVSDFHNYLFQVYGRQADGAD